MAQYQRLDGTQPNFPPAYDDLDDTDMHHAQPVDIELFEIEDGISEEPDQRRRTGFFGKASQFTKKFASNFNNAVIHPVSQMIDPMYEGYKYFNGMYEQFILKIGNPLVVKRLLYVSFIIVFIFLLTHYSTSLEALDAGHHSGGGFTLGMMYDIDKLGAAVAPMIDNKLMKENLEYLSSMPHIAGTKGDLTLAKYVQDFMINNGIKDYDLNAVLVNLNYPKAEEGSTYVKLADNSFLANLKEFNQEGMEHLAYNQNALNTNNVVKGHYVYANYGTREDFEALHSAGVNLKGAVLLIKYGGGDIPDSNKVSLATLIGASAIVFISTPYIDSEGNRHEDIIEKWNVGLERYSTGDVLTPGWSSGEGYVTRLPWFKSESTPKIPTIPISYADAKEFLKKIGEKGAKFDDGNYSGDASGIEIELQINNEPRPTHQIWNVVGSIEGREQSNKGLIIGASRDASCFGTLSTNTGTVVLLELVKIFTAMQRKFNWSPARSIYFISFDGSEYNLAGLTEWIENRKDQLKDNGYTYIDLSDVITGDELQINAHPLFHEVIRKVLQKVKTEGDDQLLYDLYKSQNNNKDDIPFNLIELKNYIPFINFLNIPSMEIKFTSSETNPEKRYPKNSCYDSFQNFEALKIDSDMKKHKVLVELFSKLILELVESPLIPFNFNDLSNKLHDYEQSLENYANEIIAKDKKTTKPIIHYERLTEAISRFKQASGILEDWNVSWREFLKNSGNMEPTLVAMNRWKQNENMIGFGGKFIKKDLKSRRPGYVNALFGVPYDAPSFISSGNMKDKNFNIFPGVKDYLDDGDYARAQSEIDNVAQFIEAAAVELQRG